MSKQSPPVSIAPIPIDVRPQQSSPLIQPRMAARYLMLVGQFIDEERKADGRLKRIQFLSDEGLQWLKVSKAARLDLSRSAVAMPLVPGTWLSLGIEQKRKGHKVKRKIQVMRILASPNQVISQVLASAQEMAETERQPNDRLEQRRNHRLVKIRVCDQGSCRKRGGPDVYAALQAQVAIQGLGDRVKIERSGCLGKCKQAPSLKVGKTCHGKMCPAQTAAILQGLVD